MAASDAEFKRQFPVLWDFLTLTGVGGVGRKPGTLLLFFEDGKCKGCLNDKEEGFYAFVSAETVSALLESLDGGLKAGKLDWRANKTTKR